MAGLTEAGFEKKTLAEIKTELEDMFRTLFGPFINLLPGSVFTTLIGIFADRLSEVWDVMEETYNSAYPDTAQGVSLDQIGAINNIPRLGATRSTATGVLLFGDVGTNVTTSLQVSVQGNPTSVFSPDNDVTLVAGANSIQTLEFSAAPDAGTFTLSFGDETTPALTHTADNEDIQDALNDFDALSGVVVTGNYASGFDIEFDELDGLQEQTSITCESNLTASAVPVTPTVTQTQVGVPQGQVNMTATATGPKDAPSGTINVIDTPVSGLTRVTNPVDAEAGRNRETDAEYRTRRGISLSISGSTSVDAIRAKLLALDDVTAVAVLENVEITEVDGRPAKSFEAIIDGGNEEEIAQTIWDNKPAGIKAYGNTSQEIADSLGQAQEISFSRAVDVPIFLSIDLETDNAFPANGADTVLEAILDYADTMTIGQDVVVYPTLIAQLATVPGIIDITIRIDTSAVSTTPGAAAVDDNVSIGYAEKAEFSAPNININEV
jgi:uncharacterized phage protein gp47/JayE